MSIFSRKAALSITKQIRFKRFIPEDKALSNLLQDYFLERIQPLYGDQSQALEKINSGKDRFCDFLIYLEKEVGLVVYKNYVSNEFIDFGIENGLEIKTVLLIDKKIKTAGLFFQYLFSIPAQKALEMNASCLFATVSSNRPEVLHIMCKLGFEVVKIFQGKYIEDADEYLVCHFQPKNLLCPFSN